MKLKSLLIRSRLAPIWGLMLWALFAPQAQAQAHALLIDFSAEARKTARNDEVRTIAFAEATGAAPAEVAKQVNRQIEDGLRLAKTYPAMKVQTGNTQTYPVYGKNSRIEGWRMRSDLMIVSQDAAQMSELLGKLQGTMGVSSISNGLSSAAFLKAENQATLEAIDAFKEKAKLIASSFGKPYRIISLNIGGQMAGPPGPPMVRAMLSAADGMMVQPPIEGGESEVNVRVAGRIEIAD